MPTLDIRRLLLSWPAVALVVLVVELGATLGAASGEPFTPVDGWGPTTPVDGATYVLVVLGCAALALLGRFPLVGATIATGSYVLFAVRDHELGMFLSPMVAVLALSAVRGRRPAAILCALVSLAAALVWVGRRAVTVVDPGAALLGWVAFGTVLAVFFLGPLLVGEVVRARRELRALRAAGPGNIGAGPVLHRA
ncbi:MAG: hypothetical protein ACTHXO_06845 [Actinomycetaceae bacterium]